MPGSAYQALCSRAWPGGVSCKRFALKGKEVWGERSQNSGNPGVFPTSVKLSGKAWPGQCKLSIHPHFQPPLGLLVSREGIQMIVYKQPHMTLAYQSPGKQNRATAGSQENTGGVLGRRDD